MIQHMRIAVVTALMFLFCTRILIAGASQDPPQLMAGSAIINITPNLPVKMAGYGGRTELSTGVHDSLYARAVFFQQGSGKLVLVSTDLLGFYNQTYDSIAATVCQKFKLQPEELFLSSIHTHSAPALNLDEGAGHANNIEYTRKLESLIVRLIAMSQEKMQPVSISTALGSSPVGVNRRQFNLDDSGWPKG
jgi:hypothetical protein